METTRTKRRETYENGDLRKAGGSSLHHPLGDDHRHGGVLMMTRDQALAVMAGGSFLTAALLMLFAMLVIMSGMITEVMP
ncbi:MAG: hypothetical protein PWQ62_1242 [Candidatus Methanomethylophilaceae archaeon]|nr:hypothetical protein [Candidatus Methanomethylophilaceae archaeon]